VIAQSPVVPRTPTGQIPRLPSAGGEPPQGGDAIVLGLLGALLVASGMGLVASGLRPR
jgi:hypothetical protein